MSKHGDIWRSSCGMMELRCGDYREVLADVECDAVITDPPYSERTEVGTRSMGAGQYAAGPVSGTIRYGHVSQLDIERLCNFVDVVAPRWFVMFGDHNSAMWSMESMRGRERWYSFQPIPWTKQDGAPRLHADGPSCQSEWIAIARPRRKLERHEKRFRPGYYHGTICKGNWTGFAGAKPLWLMRAIVRDYSEQGDLIAEPHCGTGTTLLAAAQEGRRCIGAEIDPDTFDLAVKRLSAGYTPDMFAGVL